jgi:penicillin-binding protein 2
MTMSRSERQFNWHRVFRRAPQSPESADPQRRMRLLLMLLAALLAVVFLRCIQLEVAVGRQSRDIMLAPLTQTEPIRAARGRIMARDGTVLALDQSVDELLIHYQSLQPSANRDDLHDRLTELCGLTRGEWNRRCQRIRTRVERMAMTVNRRRQTDQRWPAATASSGGSWTSLISSAVTAMFAPPDELPTPPITIREETEFHTVISGVPSEVVGEIESNADNYPGVVIRQTQRRRYPSAKLAAHMVGHVATDDRGDTWRGAAGVESRFDSILTGTAGTRRKQHDAHGGLIDSTVESPPAAGHDVVLTLDPELQRQAEELLDDAVRNGQLRSRRQASLGQPRQTTGGAIVLMDVDSGEILVAASAPRFDPNDFSLDRSASRQRWLSHPDMAMFDRTLQMAIPPGSVFKPLTAIALLESSAFDPAAPLVCRGYLHDPSRQRCLLFQKFGVGHGPIDLPAALAQSCNVYFFHHASRLGPAPLVSWAARFGFGQKAGIELPGEAAGHLPTPRERYAAAQDWTDADTEALAIGQGSLTVTPLQVVRMMAAIANGGHLVRPRITRDAIADSGSRNQRRPHSAATKIPGLDDRTLKLITESLRRTVTDPTGTANVVFQDSQLDVAAKTGTAETGGGEDHAWFAGFAPAAHPQVAFVVAIEHGGSGADAAAPVARDLLQFLFGDLR